MEPVEPVRMTVLRALCGLDCCSTPWSERLSKRCSCCFLSNMLLSALLFPNPGGPQGRKIRLRRRCGLHCKRVIQDLLRMISNSLRFTDTFATYRDSSRGQQFSCCATYHTLSLRGAASSLTRVACIMELCACRTHSIPHRSTMISGKLKPSSRAAVSKSGMLTE